MTIISEAIPGFVNELRVYEKTWKSLESHVITAKDNGRWLALCIVIRLSASEKFEEEKGLFRIENRIAILYKVQKIDLNTLTRILEELGKGSFRLADIDLVLEGFTSCDHIKEKAEKWTREQLTDIEGWPAVILRSYGKSASELLKNYNELNESLNVHSEPYDSLEQLSRKYVGLEVGSGRASCLYVVAPLYYKLDNISLSESGELKASLKCHKCFDPSDFKLSVVYSSGPTVIDNFRIGFPEVKSVNENFIECPIDEKRNKEDVLEARLYLTYKGKKIRHDWFTCKAVAVKKNLRLITHEALDEDLEGLVEALKSGKKKHFEPAISVLLHLAGLNVEPLGGVEERLGRPFIDILAFTPDNRYLLVIGCTIENISPDEITKIAEKAKLITRTYSDLHEYIEVKPVLFTSLADKDISESVKKRAKEDDVLILSQESISDVLNKIQSGYSVHDILNSFGIPRVTFI